MSHSESMLARRERLMGPSVQTFYDEPVHLVSGEGVWVWDADGRRYLDCYNNVPHVGHCHPKVVEAIAKQAATLNTHTRYLHDNVLDYLELLTASFADPLSCGILTCSGSESNDVAMRMAQAKTGNLGFIATDHTYHGNTALVSQLSKGKVPIGGHVEYVHHVPAPDSVRPLGGEAGDAHARAFGAAVGEAIQKLQDDGYGLAAFVICPYFANEGFPDLAPGFLDEACKAVRSAGGLVIADEVQCGFGRTGNTLWCHDDIGLKPDIVTLGKPMGNGHPVSAVVTSQEILGCFREHYRYFNTFGGNAVSAAAAMATFQVLEEEGLQENAVTVGNYARDGLRQLQDLFPVIGDVRGKGLFFGAEMLLDSQAKTPATQDCHRLANAMRQRGVLLNYLGIHYNTLKIRPPMPFSKQNVDLLIETLGAALKATPVE